MTLQCRIQIAVRVLRDKTAANEPIHGVCSHYLAALSVGQSALVSVHNSFFRAPENPLAPVIMVGPGTGLAPMMGFLEDRELLVAEGQAVGPCHVFTGCRHRHDQIYGTQLKQHWLSSVITKMQVQPLSL